MIILYTMVYEDVVIYIMCEFCRTDRGQWTWSVGWPSVSVNCKPAGVCHYTGWHNGASIIGAIRFQRFCFCLFNENNKGRIWEGSWRKGKGRKETGGEKGEKKVGCGKGSRITTVDFRLHNCQWTRTSSEFNYTLCPIKSCHFVFD